MELDPKTNGLDPRVLAEEFDLQYCGTGATEPDPEVVANDPYA